MPPTRICAGHHSRADLKVDDMTVLRRRQGGIIQIVSRQLKLRLHVCDCCIDTVNFGFVLQIGTFELGQCRIVGCLGRIHPGQPLFHSFLAHCLLLRQLVEDPLLILSVLQLHLGLLRALGRRIDICLQHFDVLLGRSELRGDLVDFVLVGTAIELKQRLALLDRGTFLDKHCVNKRWLREARNELDRSLNDSCIGGIRRNELEAYHENKQQMNNKEAEDNSPAGRKSDELESKKNKPKHK